MYNLFQSSPITFLHLNSKSPAREPKPPNTSVTPTHSNYFPCTMLPTLLPVPAHYKPSNKKFLKHRQIMHDLIHDSVI